MSQLAFHLDEDFGAHSILRALRTRGVDVTSVADAGLFGQSDFDQLDWATRHRRCLVTYNASDFCRLHTSLLEAGEHHHGIIIADQGALSIGETVRALLRLRAALNNTNIQDRLEFLSRW